jgi:hypothetical protein
MINSLPKLPVRSRLPIQAWILAGIVTLFSLVSSLTQVPTQAVIYAAMSHVQPITR